MPVGCWSLNCGGHLTITNWLKLSESTQFEQGKIVAMPRVKAEPPSLHCKLERPPTLTVRSKKQQPCKSERLPLEFLRRVVAAPPDDDPPSEEEGATEDVTKDVVLPEKTCRNRAIDRAELRPPRNTFTIYSPERACSDSEDSGVDEAPVVKSESSFVTTAGARPSPHPEPLANTASGDGPSALPAKKRLPTAALGRGPASGNSLAAVTSSRRLLGKRLSESVDSDFHRCNKRQKSALIHLTSEFCGEASFSDAAVKDLGPFLNVLKHGHSFFGKHGEYARLNTRDLVRR